MYMYVKNLVVFMYVNLHVCLVSIYGLRQTISFNDRDANKVIKKQCIGTCRRRQWRILF